MLTPEVTIKLIEERFWGAKAMERRVIRCCSDNPNCLFQAQCCQQYDWFLDARDVPIPKTQWPSYKRSIETRLLNYHRMRQAGIPSREAARRTTNKQTILALATLEQSP
jgi:hypothetical protein